MPKAPTLPTISGSYASSTQLNDAFREIEDAFENTLSLDGSTPNAMDADLDMNSNDILNVGTIEVEELTVNGKSVQELADRAESAADRAEAVGIWDTRTQYAAWVAGGGVVIAGRTYWVGGLPYQGSTGATETGLTGLIPHPLYPANPLQFGALGNGVNDSAAFAALAAFKPSAWTVTDGNYRIDPVTIDWPCHIVIEPTATIEQRTTGVIGTFGPPSYTITRQALLTFADGSEGSICEGGGWFDGRRAAISGFVDERRSKWGAVDVFASNVSVRNLNARNFHTFPFSNEGDYSSMENLYVEDSGQGAYCGVFKASETPLANLPLDGKIGQTFKNITVKNIDNNGQSGIFQHAVDVMYSHHGTVENINVFNQSGDAAGSSTYASGITILSCIGSKFNGLSHDGFDTPLGHLAFSMVGNIACTFSGIRAKDYGENTVGSIGIEDISNIDCTFSDYVLKGAYFSASPGITGVNYNVGAQYAIANRGRRRSLVASKSTHVNGRVLRGTNSYILRGAKPKLSACVAVGPDENGAIIDYWDTTNSYGDPDIRNAELCEVDGLTVINPGASGINTRAFVNLSITNSTIINSGQALGASDTTRSGINATPVVASGRLTLLGNETIDDQGDTITNGMSFKPAASVGNLATVTMLNPNKFDYNQHFRIPNGGGAGVDIDARVIDMLYDEFVIEAAAPFTLSASGNTTALSGTWTTDGTDATKINGTSGALTTEVVGALWITDGAEWRQIQSISGNNTLFIEAPFTTALSADTLSFVRTSVVRGPNGAKSQQNGIRLTPSSISEIYMKGNVSDGNSVFDIRVGYSVATELDAIMSGSEYTIETPAVVVTGASSVSLTQLVPEGHSIVGAAAEVVDAISGGGFTSWALVVASAAGSTTETIASGLSGAAGTKISRAITAQSRNDTVERRLRIVHTGGNPTAGSIRVKMWVRADKPKGY